MEPSSSIERLAIHAQLEQVYRKYQGVGNADTTREEWQREVRKDAAASHLGNSSRLLYLAVVQGKSLARVRAEMLDKLGELFFFVKKYV